MTERKISVIIPCHDAEDFLAQAVGSALDQHPPPVEVIIVDDASTDGSLGLARRLATGTDTVRVLSVHERSAAAARNAGALAARGDAFVFLDADDVLGPGALAAMATALEEVPDGVAVCPWYRLTFVDGRWTRRPASSPPRGPMQDPLRAWLGGWYHPPCAVMWSRAAFEAAGRWDDRVSVNDDGDLMMRALAVGVRLTTARNGAALYRRPPPGGTSLSSGRGTREGLRSRLHVLHKLAYLLEQSGSSSRHRFALRAAFAVVADDAGDDIAFRARVDELCRRFTGLPVAEAGKPGPWAHHHLLTTQRRAAGIGARVRRAVRHVGKPPEVIDVEHGISMAAGVLEKAEGSPLREPDRHERPAVSVIIPTYNRSQLLVRAVRSVLEQTMSDLEVVVVDDGSTDDTRAAIAAVHDPRIRYLAQSRNAGVGAARNRGLRESRGDLLAFLDSDDEWSPTKLELQLACLKAAGDAVGIVYTGTIDDDGQGGTSVKRPRYRGDLFEQLLLSNVLHGGGSNVLVRRSVVATVGYFDEDLPAIEDYDYWLRASRFFQVDYVEDPVATYHDPPDSLDRRSRALRQNLIAREAMYRKHRAALRAAGLEAEFLLTTARRHLSEAADDPRGARRLALRVLVRRPASTDAVGVLLRSLVPRRVRNRRADRRRHQRGGERSLRVLLWSSTSSGDGGGVQAVYRDVAAGLRERGHQVVERWHDIGRDDPYRPLPLVLPSTKRGVVLPWTVLPAFRSFVSLTATLLRQRPDVVNVHFVTAGALHFLPLRRVLGYRLVLSAHGSDVLRPLPGNAPHLSRLFATADAITAVTGVVADAVLTNRKVHPGKVRVIPNGVDVDFWSGVNSDLSSRAPVVLALGRLLPVKGFDVLLHALVPLRERVPDASLVVVGDGDLAGDLLALSARLGVGEAVSFTGHLPPEGVRAVMASARVFALPSRSEGMPLALLEAMVAGLPCVASAVGGVPSVLVDGSGVLVPPDDPSSLAEALAEILLDDAHASSVALHGRRRAAQFSSSAATRAYEDVFRRLVL